MINNDLQELSEVKLIILFILKNINMPLTHSQLTEIVMKDSLMNYFVLHQYLSDLVGFNQIKVSEQSGKQIYDITSEGRQTLEFFENRISYSIREKILLTIIDLKKEFIKATEILSDYTPRNENEYVVDCKIIENSAPLIHLNLIVGTKSQAKSICSYWQTNAQQAYSRIISVLTDEKENIQKKNRL